MTLDGIEKFANGLFQNQKVISPYPYEIFGDNDGIHYQISGKKGDYYLEINIRTQRNTSAGSYRIRLMDENSNVLVPDPEISCDKQNILEEIKAAVTNLMLDYESGK